MKELLSFCQENLGLALLALDVLLFILSLTAIHKINRTKKKLDHITGAVEGYLAAVLSDEEQPEEPVPEGTLQAENQNGGYHSKEEEQNRLISAVLQEIFP